ncbi:MAG TPA: LuxR C-terminal-related transcriptional regulator [Acidimicrobiales bacterium]
MAGKRRAEVAATMFVSVNTVRTHTRNLLAKLEVHSSVEAVSVARRAGLGT